MKGSYTLLLFFFSLTIHASEWRSICAYQKATQQKELSPSDWLASDRRQNSITWQNANAYNLTHNLPNEYANMKQRRDFYKWFDAQIKAKGHEVVWPSMAYYVSSKLKLVKTFPLSLLARKQVKHYASLGGETVFNNAFEILKKLYASNKVLKADAALKWDELIIYKEQYVWIEGIYKMMDERSLNQIKRMAKGKFLYGLAIPKVIRFKGDITNAQDRYAYAFESLRRYCKDSKNE